MSKAEKQDREQHNMAMDKAMKKDLDEIAREDGLTRSGVIRRACREEIKRWKEERWRHQMWEQQQAQAASRSTTEEETNA